jgi:DNA-binding NarL/FixJ family response regulator
MRKISVLIVDDHKVVREGLRALLLTQPDIEIAGEAEDGRQAVSLTQHTAVDVVLMDVAMPRLNGFEATKQILKLSPATRVLALTSYGNDDCLTGMMKAGATGFLAKQTVAGELLMAIRELKNGNPFLSPATASRLKEDSDPFTNHQWTRRGRKLTPREAEVLQLIAEGHSNRMMASELGISIKTVEKHRQGVMDKLGIHHTAGLTRYALGKGIVFTSSARTPVCG